MPYMPSQLSWHSGCKSIRIPPAPRTSARDHALIRALEIHGHSGWKSIRIPPAPRPSARSRPIIYMHPIIYMQIQIYMDTRGGRASASPLRRAQARYHVRYNHIYAQIYGHSGWKGVRIPPAPRTSAISRPIVLYIYMHNYYIIYYIYAQIYGHSGWKSVRTPPAPRVMKDAELEKL